MCSMGGVGALWRLMGVPVQYGVSGRGGVLFPHGFYGGGLQLPLLGGGVPLPRGFY